MNVANFGENPDHTKPESITSLYRHFDANRNLLYVGISLNAIARLEQHRQSRWSGRIATVEIEYFQTRDEAIEAERKAIQIEQPKWNITHARKPEWPAVDMQPLRIDEVGKPDVTIDNMVIDVWIANGQRNSTYRIGNITNNQRQAWHTSSASFK